DRPFRVTGNCTPCPRNATCASAHRRAAHVTASQPAARGATAGDTPDGTRAAAIGLRRTCSPCTCRTHSAATSGPL
ncbi:MAG: hypothetical protein ABJI13_00030, partial [Alphaproteobacteria bacterium]